LFRGIALLPTNPFTSDAVTNNVLESHFNANQQGARIDASETKGWGEQILAL